MDRYGVRKGHLEVELDTHEFVQPLDLLRRVPDAQEFRAEVEKAVVVSLSDDNVFKLDEMTDEQIRTGGPSGDHDELHATIWSEVFVAARSRRRRDWN